MNARFLPWLFLFIGFTLAACGGGGGGGNSAATGHSVAGIAYKGPLRLANVTVFTLQADGSNGAVLGSGATASDGTFDIAGVDDSDTGCIAVIVAGGSFVDEATGATVTLSAGQALGAAICNNGADVADLAVTPLTNAALSRIRSLAADGVSLVGAVASSNASTAQQWGLPDAIGTPPLDPLTIQASPADVIARIAQLARMQHALLIAAMSEVADDNGVAVFDFISGIAADAADGLLDGTDDGVQITLPTDGSLEIPLSASQALADVQASADVLLAGVPLENGLQEIFVPEIAVAIGNDGSNALAIASTSIPAFVDGNVGDFALTATGGTAPYQWTLLSGSLPPGITLTPGGLISGTATLAPGSSMSVVGPLLIQVQDATGATAVFSFAFTLVSGPPAVEGDAAPTGYVDTPFTTQYTAIGGAPPYSFTLASGTGFPPIGIFLNAGGDLSGTPTVPGTSSFAVCATDLVGATACMDVTMTVEEAPEATGLWSGTYTKTGPGDGGCTYQSGGTLEFEISSSDGVNYTGDSYVDGIMLRYIPSCDFAYYTSNTGTATLTVGTDGSVTGEVSVYIFETADYHILNLVGTLAGDTISGDVVNAAGDTIYGSFEVTRQ